MKKRFKILLVVLSLLMVCFSLPVSNAQESGNLDLVLVLDKSGSMNTADEDELMLEATKMLVEMMPSNTGRVAIIAFNRNQEVVCELTSLSDQDTVNDLLDEIDSISYKGGTNLGDALYKATTLFDDSDSTKGILVLSDGEDDFSSYEKDDEIASEEALSDAIVWANNNDCRIYTLGFNYKGSMNEGSEGYERLKEIAESTGGSFSSKTEASEIHEFFVDMLADLLGTVSQSVTNGEIEIDKYVKEANIYITSKDSTEIPDDSITLYDPDGNEVDLENNSDVVFYQSTYSAVIKLYNPEAGTWKVKADFDGEISVGYVALYEFYLESVVLDGNGDEVDTVTNGTTATISTTIMQDGSVVDDDSIYNDSSFAASAVVTSNLSGTSQSVDLTYDDGKLIGSFTFNEESVFDIVISVTSSTLNLEDELTIETTNSPIALTGESIDKQKVNKGKTIVVSNDVLDQAVSDEEGDSYTISATSSDEDIATVSVSDDGLEIKGIKWGSTRVNVTYTDAQGNSVDTSFVVKVKDIVLMIFFASLPFIAGCALILVLYLIARKSRVIKGEFTINQVSIDKGKDRMVISYSRTYSSNVFLGKRKTLYNGLKKYASDLYNMESLDDAIELLYELLSKRDSWLSEYLSEVRFVGTYLGLKGCTLVLKKGNHVSLNNNNSYGRKVKRQMKNSGQFIVFVEEGDLKLCIEGGYRRTKRRNKSNDEMSYFDEVETSTTESLDDDSFFD